MHLLMEHPLARTCRYLVTIIVSLTLLCSPAQALTKQDEDLIYNANFGTAEKVAELLRAGANPSAVGTDRWPAISLAAMRGDEEGDRIVRLLVEAGADLNVRDANDESPLMNAISTNNPALVKYMIERGADFRAINTSGRNVRDFANHYGNEEVAFLINEAIRLDDKRIAEGRSRSRMHRMLDDYIYYSCAMQYIGYNMSTHLYRKDEEEKVRRLLEQVQARVGNAQVELQHNFGMQQMRLQSVSRDTQAMIRDELEGLISNRNRLQKGVGKDADLDARCKQILARWQPSYKDYMYETK